MKVSVKAISEAKGLGVVAEQLFTPGSVVVSAQLASRLTKRTSHSIETLSGQHILMDEVAGRINHSCQPTTRPRPNRHGAFDFVAIRTIQPGDEVTFDYSETESELVQTFACACESEGCRRSVIGRARHAEVSSA